jgi:hypothetical protein
MENRADAAIDAESEGPVWPYVLLNGFAVLSAVAGVFYLGVGVLACFSAKSSEVSRALSAGLLLVVAALLQWAICDFGTRQRRIEREQRQIRSLLDRQFRDHS